MWGTYRNKETALGWWNTAPLIVLSVHHRPEPIRRIAWGRTWSVFQPVCTQKRGRRAESMVPWSCWPVICPSLRLCRCNSYSLRLSWLLPPDGTGHSLPGSRVSSSEHPARECELATCWIAFHVHCMERLLPSLLTVLASASFIISWSVQGKGRQFCHAFATCDPSVKPYRIVELLYKF